MNAIAAAFIHPMKEDTGPACGYGEAFLCAPRRTHRGSHMALKARFIQWLIALLAASAFAPAMGAAVCRTAAFAGMSEDVARIKRFVGPDTADPAQIRVYITRIDGVQYLQSNFLSATASGGRYDYPTKLRTNEVGSLTQALVNIVWDGQSRPDDAAEQVARILPTVTVMLDKATVDSNGRPLLNLSGARKIHLVTATSSLKTGTLEVLNLAKPPPSVVETIAGCCLKGRPPGRAHQILAALTARKLGTGDVTLLNMVVDTATARVIDGSPELAAARGRSGFSAQASWDQNIDTAMAASRGRSLLLLGHIEGADVAVLDRAGDKVFAVSLEALRQKAQANDVELVVLGCDTAKVIEENALSLGVVGVHNSKTLAQKVAAALPHATNLAELAERLSGPDLTLVAYEKAGGNGFEGTSAFAPVTTRGFLVRVFRLLRVR